MHVFISVGIPLLVYIFIYCFIYLMRYLFLHLFINFYFSHFSSSVGQIINNTTQVLCINHVCDTTWSAHVLCSEHNMAAAASVLHHCLPRTGSANILLCDARHVSAILTATCADGVWEALYSSLTQFHYIMDQFCSFTWSVNTRSVRQKHSHNPFY